MNPTNPSKKGKGKSALTSIVTSPADRVLQEIADASTVLQSIRLSQQRLKQREAKVLTQLSDRVAEVIPNATLGQLQQLFDAAYWADPQFAGRIRNAFKGLVRGGIKPTPRVVTVGPCRRCGEEYQKTVGSWAEYEKADSPRWGRAECESCKAVERRELEERSAAAERHYERQNEALSQEIKRLRALPYKEYLQSPHWKSLTSRMMYRAGFRCQLCNAGNIQLNTHHRTYERLGCEQYGDLIVLCRPCHERHHGIEEGGER